MPHFITVHDGSEPYKSMAENLAESVKLSNAGECHIIECLPNGGDMFSELLMAAYPTFSKCVRDDITILIDSDCAVVRSPDELYRDDYIVAAVHRGKCKNEMGPQDYLAHMVAFNPAHSSACRQFYIHWCIETMRYAMEGPEVSNTGAIEKGEKLRARGWTHAKWYTDQTALNYLISKFSSGVLKLPRGKYSADCAGGEAIIVHAKGGNKVQ